ncbi:MAG: hypothetical protein ACXV7J_00630 [Methylomonas sp.]
MITVVMVAAISVPAPVSFTNGLIYRLVLIIPIAGMIIILIGIMSFIEIGRRLCTSQDISMAGMAIGLAGEAEAWMA